MDVKAITQQIRSILTAPNVDLATVSSKKVRKELAETFGAAAIKENKEAIDALIIDSFNQIATAAGATQPAPPPQPEQQVKAEQSTYATSQGVKIEHSNGSSSAARHGGADSSKQRDRIKQQQPESEEEEEDGDEDDDGSDYESEPRNGKKVTPAKSHSNGAAAPAPASHASSRLKESPQKKKLSAAASMDSIPPSSSPSVPLSMTLGAGLTDEEYARQLQAELDRISGGRSTRGSGSASTRSKSSSSSFNKKGGKRGRSAADSGSGSSKKYRSKAYIDDSDLEGEGHGGGRSDDDDDGSDEAPKKKRRGGGGNSGGGYNKELALSESLQKVCGVPTMSRPKIVKRLWEYIREHQLQDPNRKSDILNDDLFKEIFGVEKMTMFSMNKYLTKSVKPIDG